MNDTICAIATPIGIGGVGIVRMSGPKSCEISDKFFTARGGKKPSGFTPYRMYYGTLDLGSFRDSCLCVRFSAPNSFTGEDVVEFHCHSGAALLQGVLRALIDGGARLAQCGEFSKRAFVNGKLTLAQAEGMIDLINSRTEAQLSAASSLMMGELSRKIEKLQGELRQLLSHIEVSIDYADEGIEEKGREEILTSLKGIYAELSKLAAGYGRGSAIREGVKVALCGKPNVGKSSLFNALLGYERAIVTHIAGTTRDALEGEYVYEGALFRVYDTAGIRESAGLIESKGVELSKKYIQESDIAVFIAESGQLSDEDEDILRLIESKRHIKVKSKADLDPSSSGFDIAVSSLTGENVDRLKRLIYGRTIGKVYTGGLILTNYRHYDAVKRAMALTEEVLSGGSELFLDMIAQSLRQAFEALGEVTGESSIESVIDDIFSRFCLGK
jgi:tRNA modification GTPase